MGRLLILKRRLCRLLILLCLIIFTGKVTQPPYPGPGAEDSDSAASAPERGQVRGRDGLRGAVQDRVHRQDGGGPRQEVGV